MELFFLACVLSGEAAVIVTPREESPQLPSCRAPAATALAESRLRLSPGASHATFSTLFSAFFLTTLNDSVETQSRSEQIVL